MNESDDLFYLKKGKTFLKVLLVHCLVALVLFWPKTFSKPIKETKIEVRHKHWRPIVASVPSKQKSKTPPPVQKTKVATPKNLVNKTVTTVNKKRVSRSLKRELLEQLNVTLNQPAAAIKDAPKADIQIPKKVNLSIDYSLDEIKEENVNYYERLIYEMQMLLRLPEFGQIKMRLVINKNGSISDMEILSSKSKGNEAYLKRMLPTLEFPWFEEFCSKENRKQIIILFKNE